MGYVGLGSHVAEQNSVHQRAVYPEPFALYSFDTNRGINARVQLGTNLAATWNQRLSINGFLAIQQPSFPPYKDLPQIPQFPTVTRRYPRITTDLQVSFQVWRKIYMITQFYLQYDKVQLPLYVPNFVYSLFEGFEINF